MATTSERPVLRGCAPCWDARDSPIDQHRCWARICESHLYSSALSVELCDTTSCDCPCREEKHSDLATSDLTTIDLGHDLGLRDLTSQFGEEE